MSLFDWSDRFSVNVEEMNEHHKKLIGILNLLHDEKLAERAEEVLGKVLDELVDYTKIHFKKEEELLEQYEFPELAVHKKEHENLILKVDAMQKKYYAGNKDMTTDVAILLNDWLAEHIVVKDKKYGIYLNSKGVS
ncbi:MAG TPA: bacteriohemerythrin [Nitrospinota bacterium]|jgi:hemerythrin|nr:bacteriohemerythrin [Nitrospinota bacterium]|tara:strand:+ start:295 stop:702 length:408 start_codon:yes stop_codon:yes gene_type:complete